MDAFKDRRVVMAVAGGAALLVLLLIVVFLVARGHKKPGAEAGAQARLQLAMDPDAKFNKAQPQRCYVNGQFVGEFPLADCAQKNGVAAKADVGLDASGPVVNAAPGVTPMGPAASAGPAPGASADCLRYGADGWKGGGAPVSLAACVRVLYEGHCARPGEAVFGRWGASTLRLYAGRISISDDGRNWRGVADQDPQSCAIQPG